MKKNEITCIVCPIGCKIKVNIIGNHCEILDGNRCKRGIEYVQSEALDPRRILTSSILVLSGDWPLTSVKTTKPVPKNMIPLVLTEIKKTIREAPINIGDILLKNVCDLDIDVVATKKVIKSIPD